MAMTKRVNKYLYLKVIQGDYGCGWEDLCAYDTADPEEMKECRSDYKAYRENERQYAHRVIRRRELNPEWKKD